MSSRLCSRLLRSAILGSLKNRVILPSVIKQNVNTSPALYQSSFSKSLSKRTFSTANEWSDEKFKSLIQNDKLVVFMKGTPDQPMCGFSKYVIQILNMHGCEKFKTLNVLEDDELRNRVKEFSNWPTIPQVYIDGEFVGGFDILLQMHQNGELIDELDKIGHRSNLIDSENNDS